MKTLNNMDKTNHFPLSSGQQGLWLLHQLDPVSDRYHMPLTFTFADHIRVDQLADLLTTFVQRHDMLHSTFVQTAGEPVRQVSSIEKINISEHDCHGMSHKDLISKIREISSQPFDLTLGPLFRPALLKGSECGDVLLISIHHLIFDGASLKIMVEELTSIHQTMQGGEPLKALTHSYHDFVMWQQNWLDSKDAATSKNYWLQQLSGDLPQLNLPADFQTDNHTPVVGDFIKFDIPSSVVEPFKQMAKNHSCSEYVVWLTAYFAFLSRYTSQADVIIGTPSMGRPDAQFDQLVGYFVNLIPLRCQVDSAESFIDLLSRFKNDIYAGLMHADYPLSALIKDLGDANQRGDQPLFQSSFVWTVASHLQAKQDSLLGLSICPLVHESGEQSLSLEMLTTEVGISGLLKYRTNQFSYATALKIQGAFFNFIQSIAIEADSEIKELTLVSEQEEHRLLHQMNNNTLKYPEHHACIHHLIEQQVKQNPAATAVEFGDRMLTYSELNSQANQLAHFLLSQQHNTDVQPMIAICVDRSLDMIIGLLAILKAGAAYVPIDPSLPANRRTHLLEDSGVAWLLTQQHLSDLNAVSCQQILLDDPATQCKWTRLSKSNPDSGNTTADSLAYVIYTSGSTGLPKGVMQTHRTVVNLVHAQASDIGLRLPLRTLQFAPFSFDVSIQEISTSWLTGSALILINQSQKEALHQLPVWLKELRIERMFLPPAVLNWLTEAMQKQNLELIELREIIVAGETLVVSNSLKTYMTEHPHCHLWNHYGPTETHVASIAVVDVNQTSSSQPIGFVLPNLSAFILDAQQQVVPFGAVGELYIGGAGLATGYLNQPDLTQQQFKPNPYSYTDNELLYRTGDLVRYLDDGQLEFIGRLDEQVKIRGFRVELGEVEQQLNSLAMVQTAVVSMIETPAQQKQLVAYVCAHPSSTYQDTELLDHIKAELLDNLPAYMVPDNFVLLSELPLTVNGKVDRNSLPIPELGDLQGIYVAPTGEIELKMVAIWSALLNIPEQKISAEASFFELGGHSLLVARLINEVQQSLNSELSYRVVFTKNTLQKISAEIEHQLKTKTLVESLASSSDDSIEEMEW